MSIRRQLALCIGLLMLFIMSGNLLINIKQLQSHYEQQLKARADETVTTLSLSMTQAAQFSDDAQLRSMLDVVFDRGHFSEIRFDYVDSDRSVSRHARPDLAPDVPKWFQQWMSLRAGVATAHVSQGWQQLGDLTVKLHPGFMYQQLWKLVKAEIAWFAMMLFFAVYGLRLLLHWQLMPLKQVLVLVDKLAHNQFVHITKQPKARELKSLVNSMNMLSDRLQDSFIAHGETVRQLQEDSFHDSLTLLNNRKGWNQFLTELLNEEGFRTGWMMLLEIENLTELNNNQGKQQVDELLTQLAQQLKHDPALAHEHVCLARTNGGEFWLHCPDSLDEGHKERIKLVSDKIQSLALVQEYQAHLCVAAIALHQITSPASIKHQLDLLLRRCQTEQQTLLIGEVDEHTLTNWDHWRDRLTEVLKQGGIQLYAQPLFDASGESIQKEIHCRLPMEGDEPLLAGYFWPMVEKLNLTVAFDQLVIEKWAEYFQSQSSPEDWVLNISGKSLADADFRQWFESHLTDQQKAALIIEFSEYSLVHSSKDTQQWLANITQQGVRLSVDHIGTTGKGFGFLARFPLHQGKVERRFIRNIDQQKENRFFVSGMIKVFHSQNTLCFAEGVESGLEKSTLQELGVDGVMGYGLAKPYQL
ncbi:MAG: EAL domain-containing protein [Bermanella sp.]